MTIRYVSPIRGYQRQSFPFNSSHSLLFRVRLDVSCISSNFSYGVRGKKLLAKIQNSEEPPGKDPQAQFERLNEKIPEKVSI